MILILKKKTLFLFKIYKEKYLIINRYISLIFITYITIINALYS